MPYSNRPNPWRITLHPFEAIADPKPRTSLPNMNLTQCPKCGRRRSENQFRVDPRDTRSRATRVCYECRRKQ